MTWWLQGEDDELEMKTAEQFKDAKRELRMETVEKFNEMKKCGRDEVLRTQQKSIQVGCVWRPNAIDCFTVQVWQALHRYDAEFLLHCKLPR